MRSLRNGRRRFGWRFSWCKVLRIVLVLVVLAGRRLLWYRDLLFTRILAIYPATTIPGLTPWPTIRLLVPWPADGAEKESVWGAIIAGLNYVRLDCVGHDLEFLPTSRGYL